MSQQIVLVHLHLAGKWSDLRDLRERLEEQLGAGREVNSKVEDHSPEDDAVLEYDVDVDVPDRDRRADKIAVVREAVLAVDTGDHKLVVGGDIFPAPSEPSDS